MNLCHRSLLTDSAESIDSNQVTAATSAVCRAALAVLVQPVLPQRHYRCFVITQWTTRGRHQLMKMKNLLTWNHSNPLHKLNVIILFLSSLSPLLASRVFFLLAQWQIQPNQFQARCLFFKIIPDSISHQMTGIWWPMQTSIHGESWERWEVQQWEGDNEIRTTGDKM